MAGDGIALTAVCRRQWFSSTQIFSLLNAIVLTYHSNNILGSDYASNDHLALAADLQLLSDCRIEVVPLQQLARCVLGQADWPAQPTVALSFDDGSWFDWYDLPHPAFGLQPSFRRILAEAPSPVCATSFVIASPQARQQLDRSCLIGQGWWGDEWWPEAAAGELIQIENHSWDHNHETLLSTVLGDRRKGTFYSVNDDWAAEREIVAAKRYIEQRCGRGLTSELFAYPYGEAPDFLVREFFPRRGRQLGFKAAFTTEPKPLSAGDDPWTLGRYVCGFHWTNPDQLRQILRDAKLMVD